MYSKDQILLEQAYQNKVRKTNSKWSTKNIFKMLEELDYKCGERTGTKGDIIVEVREAKRPHPLVKVQSNSNKFSEICYGENTPGDLEVLQKTLIGLG